MTKFSNKINGSTVTINNVVVVEVVVDDDSDAGGQDEVLDLGEALSEVLFAVKNVHEKCDPQNIFQQDEPVLIGC